VPEAQLEQAEEEAAEYDPTAQIEHAVDDDTE